MFETHDNVKYIHIIGEKTREWLVDGSACKTLGHWGIRLTGISFALPPFEFMRPNWNFSQLLACVGGHGEILVDGQWMPCEAGTVYLTPRGVLHAYRASHPKTWHLCWVMYGPDATNGPIVATTPLSVQADIRPLRMAIEGLYRESLGRSDQLCMETWAELIGRYAARICHKPASGRLWPFWDQIQHRLAAPWTLEKMAALAQMSGEHFRRLCHTELGRSPMKHLTWIRMRHAAGMLTGHQLTIEAIAQAVGYTDRFGFSNAFKKEFGLTPGEFRKKVNP